MDADKIKMFDELSDKGKEEVLKRLEFENMKEETINRMRTDPDIQKFFEKFNHHSIEYFITSYANQKEVIMKSGAELTKHNYNHEYRFRKEATKGLEQILAKKLLMKMCEWSAGLIELEGIETSDDFYYWYQDLFNCPFIEPITQEEVDIYTTYFKSRDYEEYDKISIYTYLLVRPDYEKYEDNGEPEFSILYDTMKGTTDRWLLPDIKVAREKVYKKIFNEERMRKYHLDIAEGRIKAPQADDRPSLDSSNKEQMEEFIRKFESPQFLDYFRNRVKFTTDHVHTNRDGDLIPTPKERNVKEQTLDSLQNVFEDYLFRVENGLSFEINVEKTKGVEDTIARGKMEIREGRILLGEPGNLDIY